MHTSNKQAKRLKRLKTEPKWNDFSPFMMNQFKQLRKYGMESGGPAAAFERSNELRSAAMRDFCVNHLGGDPDDTEFHIDIEQLMLDSEFENERRHFQQLQIDMTAVQLSLNKAFGLCTHVYLPNDEFCKWLIGCVKDYDDLMLEVAHEQFGQYLALYFRQPSMFTPKLVAIQQGAVLNTDGKVHNEVSQIAFCGEDGITPGVQDVCFFTPVKKFDPEWYAGQDKEVMLGKLIIGLGMYASRFPDQVIPGPPQSLRGRLSFDGGAPKAVRIGVSPEVVTTGSDRIPHFRCGHLRVLRSPRFKNKRGTCVFVKATFVKGRAITVLDPNN